MCFNQLVAETLLALSETISQLVQILSAESLLSENSTIHNEGVVSHASGTPHFPSLPFLGCNGRGRWPSGLWGEVAELAQTQPMGPSLRRLLQPRVSRTCRVGVRAKAHQHATAGWNQVSLRAV